MREIRLKLMEEKKLSVFSLIKRKLKKNFDNLKNKKEPLTLEEALALFSLEFEKNEEEPTEDFLIIIKSNIEDDLEKGLDVSWYINSDFEYWQRVEIRKGLEARIDVSKYAFVEFDAKKMYKYRAALIDEKLNKNKK